MRFLIALSLSFLSLSAFGSPSALAVDWGNPVDTKVAPLYPYKDLPGVKAQPDKKDEEQYACRTDTMQVRSRHYDTIFRTGGMPRLVYVCERDGTTAVGTQIPLRGHYQPVR